MGRSYEERNGPATRQEILNTIRHRQGLTKSQLCREVNLAWSTLSHHLRVLEREGKLVRKRVFGWRRIYTVEAEGPELSLIPLLRESSIVPRIVAVVKGNPGMGIQAISRQLSIGRKTAKRHLDGLVAAQVLSRSDDYHPKFFVTGQTEIEPQRQADDGDRGGDMSMHV